MKSQFSRKSIRKYSERAVSDELLTHLIDEAQHTQTMGNLQLYSVVVTRNDEMKRQLAPAHFNQPMVTEAPVVLTLQRRKVWGIASLAQRYICRNSSLMC